MSKSNHQRKSGSGRPQRRISVHGVRRDPADLRKLSRALIQLAMQEAAAEAAAQSQQEDQAGDEPSEQADA